jgi:threonine 3-dehydrogenase
MVAPEEKLKTRTYNVTAMSFTPEEIAEELRKHVPGLEVSYKPDQRQKIGEVFIQKIRFGAVKK